jgi:hypothetical protein
VLWWLGSGVERSIGVVEDADPPRTGECQQQGVVKPLELVQIQLIPPTRCAPALLQQTAAAVFAQRGMEVHGHSTRWPRVFSAAAVPSYRSSSNCRAQC